MVNQCESNTFRVSSAQLAPDGATSRRAVLTSLCDGVLAEENFPFSSCATSRAHAGAEKNRRQYEQETDEEE